MNNLDDETIIKFLTSLGYVKISIISVACILHNGFVSIWFDCYVLNEPHPHYMSYPIKQYNNFIRKQKLNVLKNG